MAANSSSLCPEIVRGICVIMAGGRGTRFWPLSRQDRPKQLLPLVGDRSLLRETYERVVPVVGHERILVVTSGGLAEATRAELPELPASHIITEPIGRNTAPCAVLGMGLAGRLDPIAPVALLPADHFIPDREIFAQQLQDAFCLAGAAATVVTLGIPPSRPETGYGYLQVAPEQSGATPRPGLAFVEKPDLERAQAYLADGCHFWNSGIFIWNPGWFATLADRHLPDVRGLLAGAVDAFGTDDLGAALDIAYRDCPADSIDFAIMEKLSAFTVLPAAFRWSDIGSWPAWGQLAADLAGGNKGQADILALDSRNNILMVKDKLVTLIGVEDLIVVDTPDALLVCRRADAQRIKEVIARLEADDRRALL